MYRVVLIDDERFVLASLEGRIEWEEHGFKVVGKAMSAAEGIALIRSERPDIVFTDIKMPGMSGLEMIHELVDEFPQIKFVIISGYNEFQYAKQAMEYGVLGFCVKKKFTAFLPVQAIRLKVIQAKRRRRRSLCAWEPIFRPRRQNGSFRNLDLRRILPAQWCCVRRIRS